MTDSPETPVLHLFEKFGIELEYMIVRDADLAVAPIADRLIEAFCGALRNECEVEGCGVSNELAAHVIELKSLEPTADFTWQEARFTDALARMQTRLAEQAARLLPGPMHPTMDPSRESFTWPHEGREIYSLYDTIFDCRGHGWFNLQSCHLNLPFAGDGEFARLHSAVILLLPLMPALTAGSPFREGLATGLADTRIEIYRHNQARCPHIAGSIIPEPVFSRDEYEETILQPMYREIAPHDPEGILRHEWLNSRGAIARFDRSAIEIRLLDVQECPAADLALARFFIAALRFLTDQPEQRLRHWLRRSPAPARTQQLESVVRSGMHAPILLPELREAFRLPSSAATAGDFWRHVFDRREPSALPEPAAGIVERILSEGNLSSRLLAARRAETDTRGFRPLLESLARCLAENRLFDARKP